jgi:AraC family transcriptional regulator, transcriptional activator of pobA
MINTDTFTLINSQTGNLAFKVFSLNDNSHFDHIQRLNYYSLIWIKKGSGKVKADFSEYNFTQNTLFAFSPYQPFMFQTDEQMEGVVLNFHPDFFCIHKHQQEVACNGVTLSCIEKKPIQN